MIASWLDRHLTTLSLWVFVISVLIAIYAYRLAVIWTHVLLGVAFVSLIVFTVALLGRDDREDRR